MLNVLRAVGGGGCAADHGLEHLTDLKNLDRLYVSGTQVTDEGVKKILKDLPNCKIISRLPMVHEIPPFQGS